MDYQKHYNKLIERAKNCLLEGYIEKHHIMPRCMNGSNDAENIVALTPEEHYVAHQLLVKIYPNEPKLVYVAHMMTVASPDHDYRKNKLYGWLRRRMSESFKGNTHGKASKGKKRSNETKRKISESKKGHIPWNKGLKIGSLSKETKRKISKSLKGRSSGMLGKKHTEETKKKISESGRGNKNAEGKTPWNKGKKGGSSWMKGKKHTEETKKKISEALKKKHKGIKHE